MAVRPLQLTLAILKPDLLLRPIAAQGVREVILREGFYVLRSAMIRWRLENAMSFYREHREKFFFHRLVSYMCSGPMNPLLLAHPDAIERWRELMGPTKSYQARVTAPDTIRGMYGLSDTRNSTHGADSEESVKREISFFFPDFGLEHWYWNEEREFRNGTLEYCREENVHKLLLSNETTLADFEIHRVYQAAPGI